MKLSLRNSVILTGLATVAMAAMVAKPASAEPVRFDGSYVGAGLAGGLVSSGLPGGERTFGGHIQGRFAVPNAPVSVRGTVMFANNNSAIIPTLTYDQAIAKNTNLNVGAGYSFVQKAGQATPLGNRDAFVLTAGVESEVTKGVVLYTDAKVGLRAYQNKPTSAVSVQGGVGLKF
jgi:hypothetical protein